MIPTPSHHRTSWKSWPFLGLFVAIACALVGCATSTSNFSSGTYHVAAYAPSVPEKVAVYVSLRAKMVYVMEGDRPLLVTPTSIGTPDHPTPTGHFTVTAKDPTKRSGEYGFWADGNDIRPGSSGSSPGAGFHYVGYPMANWVEFAPGFGFHEGYVWPVPRSHGCLRLHKNASVKFYKLVHVGTPVIIASSLPEDDTLGRAAVHPSDYKDPDPPASLMISPEYFTQPRDSDLITGTPTASAQ